MIHPHELPFGFHILQEFSVRAPLESKREFEWELQLVQVPTCNGNLLRLCPLELAPEAGFLAFDSKFNFGEPTLFSANSTRDSLQTDLETILSKARFARAFFLNENGQPRRADEIAHECVIMSPDGSAVWSRTFAPNSSRYPAHFRWNKPMQASDFLVLPSQTAWDRLQHLLEDPDGEEAFARKWAFTTKQERDEIRQQPARGTVRELEARLLDLLIFSSAWDENPGVIEMNISLNWHKKFTLWDANGEWDARGERAADLAMPPSMLQNAEQLRDFFQPFDERIGSFYCVQHSDAGPIVVNATRPSAHEQVEAMNRWREWGARR